METYRGPDRGFEVSLSDLVALGLILSVLITDLARIRWVPPLTLSFGAFFLVAFASTLMAPIPLLGLFTLAPLTLDSAPTLLCLACLARQVAVGPPHNAKGQTLELILDRSRPLGVLQLHQL